MSRVTLPSPLGLSAAAFAAGADGVGARGGRAGALAAYAALFRAGTLGGPGAPGAADPGLTAGDVALAPVVDARVSDSPEGAVVKFLQQVPRTRAGDGTAATPMPAPMLAAGAVPALETESVLIPMIGSRRHRTYTLCLSSQVGCAMGCAFCQTAQMGLVRSLTVAEIIGQWFAARHVLLRAARARAGLLTPAEAGPGSAWLDAGGPGEAVAPGALNALAEAAAALDARAPIRNVVFMGMGEPLDNLDAVMSAVEVLTDRRGPALALSRVTISTVGRIDQLPRLMARVAAPGAGWHRLGLAVSLNAPNDAVRSEIMPVNRGMPMAALRAALDAWPRFGGHHHCLEYVLIPGVTDGPGAAEQVASFVLGEEYARGLGEPGFGGAVPAYPGRRLKALVNVIPYNPREHSPWPAPLEADVEAFCARLAATGVFVKRRRTKGRDTMAACGQLGNLALRRAPARGGVALTVRGDGTPHSAR